MAIYSDVECRRKVADILYRCFTTTGFMETAYKKTEAL